MATAATSQEEDSELGMKAGEGWEEHPAGLHGGGWAFLGTQLLLPAAPQPPEAPGPSRPAVSGLQACRGGRGRAALGTSGTAAAGANELSDELSGTVPSIWR